MRKIGNDSECPKCGYKPAFNEGFDVEYKDRCYGHKCDWDDKDVDEHLHVSCPRCKYMVSQKTSDYDKLKENVWATDEEEEETVVVNNVTPLAQPRTIPYQTGYVAPVASNKTAWNTECTGCPSSKK